MSNNAIEPPFFDVHVLDQEMWPSVPPQFDAVGGADQSGLPFTVLEAADDAPPQKKIKTDNTARERKQRHAKKQADRVVGLEQKVRHLEGELERWKGAVKVMDEKLTEAHKEKHKSTRHKTHPLEPRLFNANPLNRPGLKPMAMIVRQGLDKDKVRLLRSEVYNKYCVDNPSDSAKVRGEYLTHRVAFGNDMQPPGKHRHMWVQSYPYAYMECPRLKELVEFVLEEAGHNVIVRAEGTHSAGVVALDSGDCFALSSPCARCIEHKDYDGGCLNSLVLIIPLMEDVFGLPYMDEEGNKLDGVRRVDIGDAILMTSSTYHYGCSHADYDGSEEAPCRRRLFIYLDMVDTIKDESGQVVASSECAMPKDYKVYVEENMPSLKSAFHVMTSEMSWLQHSVVVASLHGAIHKGRFLRETMDTYVPI